MEEVKKGRPTKYKESFNDQAYKLCLAGFTDSQLGDFFDVTEQTINNWKIDYPSFFESIKKGKDIADGEVAHTLYQRAKGYNFTEVRKEFDKNGKEVGRTETVKRIESDAASFGWMRNRRPDQWRDKKHVEVEEVSRPILEGGKELPEDE